MSYDSFAQGCGRREFIALIGMGRVVDPTNILRQGPSIGFTFARQ